MRKVWLVGCCIAFLANAQPFQDSENLMDSSIKFQREDASSFKQIVLENSQSQSLKILLQNALRNPLLQSKEAQTQALKEEKNALYAEYLPKVIAGYAYQETQNPDIFYPKRMNGPFMEARWLIFDGMARVRGSLM